MTKRSRILSLILILLIAISAFSATAFSADGDGRITVTTSDIINGQVTATVSISGNPGISGMSLKLSFDRAKLTPVSFDASKGIVPEAYSNITDKKTDLAAMEAITYFFASSSDVKNDGTLFSVTFKIADNAVGTTALKLSFAEGGVTNSKYENLKPILSDCTIDISGSKYPGGVITLESEHMGLDYYRVTVGFYGNPGIAALRFRVDLSKGIVVRSVDFNSIFDDVTSNATQPDTVLSKLDSITYNYTNAEDKTSTGTLFSFTFRLVDGYGRINVSYENGDVTNAKLETLSPSKSDLIFGTLDVATAAFDANTTIPLSGNSPADITVVKNSYLTLPFCPEREDHAYFLGWSEDKNATVATYAPGEKILLTDNVTFYAVWTVRTYTVSYDANGGTKAPASQTKVHGTPITLTESIPARENYDFAGWSVLKNGTAADYNAGDVYYENLSVTLFAVWRPHRYEIAFDANGGTNAPVSTAKFYGTNITLPTEIPTRSGYGFAGWSDTMSGGVKYLPGDAYSANGDTTLFAVWSSDKYDVSFDANGGTGAPTTLSLSKSINLFLPLTAPEKTGYTFLGWATSRSTTKAEYKAGDVFSKKTSTTLYAVWEVAKYTLTFDVNGGSGSFDDITFAHGSSATLPTATPTKKGHSFLGWSETANASVAEFKAGDTYKYNRSATLYAVWNPDRYIITYNANGGTNAPASQEKLYDVNLRLTAVKPIKEGFSFLGWAEGPDALEPFIGSGEIYTENRALNLYAMWTPTTYTVRYEDNNETGDFRFATKIHGTPLVITSYRPARTGYTFLGWATTPDALVPEYKMGSYYTQESGTILYAVWTVKEYTIYYDANGGSLAPGMQKKPHGASVTLVNIKPKRTDHVFIGWATTPDSTSVEYRPSETYSADADITLYAVWGQAASSATIELKAKSLGGGRMKLEILLTSNPGINFLSLRLDFDRTKVKLLEIDVNEDDEPQSALNGLDVNLNIFNIPENTDHIKINWSSTSNRKTTGVLLTATFELLGQVGDTASFSVYPLKDTTTSADVIVPTGVEAITFTVPDYMPGDLNDDGAINAKDSVLLAQYLAKWTVVLNEDAADCNGDGAINAKDSVLLAQYLANWDVALG